jgi:hypothetical protein
MTFLAGAGFTALALLGLGLVRRLTPTLGQDRKAPAEESSVSDLP